MELGKVLQVSAEIKVKVKNVKLSVCLTKHYSMKAYGGSACIDALVGGEWHLQKYRK
jgi:hypothetical protein